MAEPDRALDHSADNNLEDSDQDGDYEEDIDLEQQIFGMSHAVHSVEPEGSDIDAEGEEVDEDYLGGEPVGAVKMAKNSGPSERDDDESEDGRGMGESSSDAKSTVSDEPSGSSNSGSDVENEWEAESDAGEEVEADITDPNKCVFCGEDEEHDPSEEFEEYLACAVCGDNGLTKVYVPAAHRQCARNANCLQSDDDTEHWRCATCVDNGLEEDTKHHAKEPPATRRRSSAPKLTRDLLPAHHGSSKPDFHSVFNTLIHPDDPMDGSRSLRKRKTTPEIQEPSPRQTRKRRRPSGSSSLSDESNDGSQSRRSPSTIKVAVSKTDGAEDSEDSEPPRSRPMRPRSRKEDKPLARIIDSDGISLIVAFHLDATRLAKILSSRPRKKRVRDRGRKVQAVLEEPEMSHYPSIQTHYSTPFFGFPDRGEDESKAKPYGGILSEAEADTSKTFPHAPDRKRFEDARLKAEEDWKRKMASGNPPELSRSTHKATGPPSKIKCINFGGWEIDTWHAAPYPEEYSRNKVLYICEFCLKYMSSDYVAWRHKLKCPAKHPPGDEIYRDGRYSFFEVDGRKNPVYCQNLCLLAKLFLGSKTLYYDVEPFLFYVMTENNEYGCHFVGYFSKEKRPSSLNNVSCIHVLPIHQRKGFGHLLIEFSYLLTKIEKKTGSPEKPLSDMGLVSYRSYWRLVLCYELLNQRSPLSITDISERTGMTADDIVSALEGLRALVRDPNGTYALRLDHKYFKEYIDKFESKNWPRINPEFLIWTPYVMGRSNLSQYEDGPPLHTVAQRDDEESDAEAEEGVQMELAKMQRHNNDSPAPRFNDVSDSNGTRLDDANSASDTPQANGGPGTPNYIDPTRFKVFPPIPGQPPPKRRPGRPFGTRRRTATPARRNLMRSPSNGTMTPRSPGRLFNGITPAPATTIRRTRSRLGEVVNGIGLRGEEDGLDGDVIRINGGKQLSVSLSASRSLGQDDDDDDGMQEVVNVGRGITIGVATNGSPVKGKGKGKGKGRMNGIAHNEPERQLQQQEEEEEEEDEQIDDDMIDAEGEEDELALE